MMSDVDVLSQIVGAMRIGQPRSYVVECLPPWGRRYASVPGAGLHVVLEGTVWLLQPDGRPVRLDDGDVVLLPAGVGHALADQPDSAITDFLDDPRAAEEDLGNVVIGPDGSCATGPRAILLCGMYQLDQRRTHPFLGQLPDVIHLPGRLSRHQELGAAVTLLANELLEHRPGSHAAAMALLDLLLIQVLRTWHDQQPGSAWSVALTDPVVGAALRHMHNSPDRPWSVAHLATLAGLSRAAFAKRFKDLVGEAPLTYLTRWRMTLAAQLLEASDLPLAEVAARIGYSTEYSFAAAFKREYGISPGRFRRATSRAS
jgi:AraC-like DNA-binding protein